MNDALTALNANVGALLLVLNLALVLLVAVLVRHTSAMRHERRAHAVQVAEQLTRALSSLQKINSSTIAQTNELKGRLGDLKPALEQAEQLLREGTAFSTDFKAERGELRQLDERVDSLHQAATEAASSRANASDVLKELNQQIGALRDTVVATAKTPPAPSLASVPELRQIQEQFGALRQVVTSSAQAQAANTTELRSDLSALAAEHTRAAQAARDSIAAELRQQETRFRQLSEKFLAESTQLRTRMESESRALPTPPSRQVAPDNGHSAKAELDAETRKEFRKIAERFDSLQRRMEEIIKL